MIPENTDLTAEAQRQIEAIDSRLDEIEEETDDLLEERSTIIDQHRDS